MNKFEKSWLDYAWRVVNCSDPHLTACIEAGAAVPGKGRVEGNDVRLPGYLGRNYQPGGVLCVASVSREPSPEDENKKLVIKRTNANLYELTREWIREGRSTGNDSRYLTSVRLCYEEALPNWSRWRRHFKTLVEDYLRLNASEIAWTNLAKCRVPIHLGTKAQQAEARLTSLCQREFIPMRDIVEILKPDLVLVSVLHAGRSGNIIEGWDVKNHSPLVYSWQGRNGRSPTDDKLHEWASNMVMEVRGYRDL